jgi:CubicO group peptidase (beta-lactamase class C family)
VHAPVRVFAVVLGAAVVLSMSPPAVSPSAVPATADASSFAADLDEMREILGIPGMSVAVVQHEQVVFAEGFGLADRERGIPAAADTPYGLASVTKPIAATLVMQLVEEGVIDLDLPISSYGVGIPGAPDVTSRHLLTHTSGGVPGTTHSYDGDRYALLGGVIAGATGRSFAEELGERILVPLGMTDTALNPLDAWRGAAADVGPGALRYAIGWGELYANYPDVYRRLAEPYQFAEDYSVIPGMYQLAHSPAAGLLSSVVDLAAFDIALDQGRLVGAAARDEMLSSAYGIPGGHAGSGYGLGWYVQQFDGLTIQWHSGRWPPSTSALYARFPDLGLTLIVLANTDNLTVPFAGLGSGDVMTSALALIFHRHFVFPERYGHPMPDVEWAASGADIAAQLAGDDDPATREFLERELWAYRQAFASSGGFAQVAELEAARAAAFPGSSFVRDPLLTALAAEPSPVSPVIAARTMATIAEVLIAWIAVVGLAVAWMVWMLIGSGARRLAWALWLTATLLLGPIAPAVRRATRSPSGDTRRWQRALEASLASTTGYAVAWTVTMGFLLALGVDVTAPVLLAIYAFMFGFGLVVVRGPLFRSVSGAGYRTALRRNLIGELITVNVGIGAFLAVTLYVDDAVLSVIPFPTSPFFWAMLTAAALVGLLVLWPLEYWIDRRGFTVWPVAARPVELRLPAGRDSWWMALATFVVMVAMIGGSAALVG